MTANNQVQLLHTKDTHTIKETNKKDIYTKITDITEKDLIEISEHYHVSLAFVKFQLEKLNNYCESKGRIYKNYKSALRNFVLGDMQREIQRPHKGGVIDATNI